MRTPAVSPLRSFARFTTALRTGRLRFPTERVGEVVLLEDGRPWRIFRQAVLHPLPGQPAEPAAIFRPRFHLAGMSPRVNIWFSWLTIPFFTGLPGFRSKLWLIQPQSGDFQGIYEWDRPEDAQAYQRSFAMRFMTRRAVPGSVSSQIIRRGEGGYNDYSIPAHMV